MSKDLDNISNKLADYSFRVQQYNAFNDSTLEQFSDFVTEIHAYISSLEVDQDAKRVIMEALRIDLLGISMDIKADKPPMGFDFSVLRDQIAMKLRVFINRINASLELP